MQEEEKNINPGFFNMDLIKTVCNQTNIYTAKNLCYNAIESMPGASKENKLKARAVVDKAPTIQKLAITLTNFMLAHPSENLKVMK